MKLLIFSAYLVFTGFQVQNADKPKRKPLSSNVGVIDNSNDTTIKKKYNVRTVNKDSVAKKTPVKQTIKPKGAK